MILKFHNAKCGLLFEKGKKHRRDDAGKCHEVIPLQVFTAKHHGGKQSEYNQRDGLLNDL